MEEKQLTDEQKKKIKKLQKQFTLRMAMFGGKFAMSLLLANLFVSLINSFYVNNMGFEFVGCFISAFFIFRTFRVASYKERDRVSEELKKILSS